jgi:hypothetical protein
MTDGIVSDPRGKVNDMPRNHQYPQVDSDLRILDLEDLEES